MMVGSKTQIYIIILFNFIHLYSCNLSESRNNSEYNIDIEYSSNGLINRLLIKKGDTLDRSSFKFLENGKLSIYSVFNMEGNFERVIEFDSKGRLDITCHFDSVTNKQFCIEYFPNGRIKSFGNFIDGKQFGEFSYFDKDENLIKRINYYNDTANGNAYYYKNKLVSHYFLIKNQNIAYGVEYANMKMKSEEKNEKYFFKVDSFKNMPVVLFYYLNPPHLNVEVFKKNNGDFIKVKSENPILFPINDLHNVQLDIRIIGTSKSDTVFYENVYLASEGLIKNNIPHQ